MLKQKKPVVDRLLIGSNHLWVLSDLERTTPKEVSGRENTYSNHITTGHGDEFMAILCHFEVC